MDEREERAEEVSEDEEEQKEEEQRISAEEAKQDYGMSDEDLARLARPLLCENPDDPSARPVKLYRLRDVTARYAMKERQRQKAEKRAQERAERLAAQEKAKAAERSRQRARLAREAAKSRLHELGGGKARARAKYGASPLPEEVLALVFDRLVADLEPGGVWGPGLVARQLSSASLVCWDWYHAAQVAFDELADAVDMRLRQVAPTYEELRGWSNDHRSYPPALAWACTPAGLGWGFWDTLVAAPADLKLAQLREAAKQLRVPFSGTKPQLILRLLSALGLAGPTPVPARLLRAVALERGMPRIGDGPDGCRELVRLMQQLTSINAGRWPSGLTWIPLAAARRELVGAGICSMQDLRPVAEDARRKAELRAAEERKAYWKMLVASGRRACAVCINMTFSRECPNQCCSKCCGRPLLSGRSPVPCMRHGWAIRR